MRIRLWTWAKLRSSERDARSLENKPFELLERERPVQYVIDLSQRNIVIPDESTVEIPKGATDFAAITRFEVHKQQTEILSLDTVPALEGVLPRLRESSSKDLGLWPTDFREEEIYSAWNTLRASWPLSSYLRIFRDGNAFSFYARLQLYIPIIPSFPTITAGVSTKRANDLVRALLKAQTGSLTSREDWSELNHNRMASLSAISFVGYDEKSLPGNQRRLKFQGMLSHSSLARFYSASFSDKWSKNKSTISYNSVNAAADGQFIVERRDIADLGEVLDQLGERADGILPLTRFALTGNEAGVNDAGRLPLEEHRPLIASLGLTVAPMLARDGAGSDNTNFPYQHLYFRKGNDGFEWLTWTKIEHPESKQADAATPCLLRYRQIAQAAKGAEAHYRVSLEGLTDAHVLRIWSLLAARAARERFGSRYGRTVPSLLPDLFVKPSGQAVEVPGKFVVTITCRRVNKGAEFLGPGQAMPKLQQDEIQRVEIRRARNFAPTPAAPFPEVPTDFDELVFDGENCLRFVDLFDTSGAEPIVRSGKISFPGRALAFKRINEGLVLEESHVATLQSGTHNPDERPLDVAIASMDLQLQPHLVGGQPAFIDVRTDGSFVVQNLRIPIKEAWVRGTDADSLVGIPLDRQAAVWSTDGKPLLSAGELALENRPSDDGQESFFDIHRGLVGQIAASEGQFEVAIVDPAPFFVGAVSLQPPLSDGAGRDENLASWRSSDPRWRLLWLDSTLPENRLRLPPQGRAEDWERVAGDRDGITEGGRVAARFTRAAVVRVQAEERLRAPTGPWNIVETLTDASADLPGVRLTAVDRLEILYGLEAHHGRIDNVRIAETESWRGRPAMVPVALKREIARAKEWDKADRLWATRLAVIEARKDHPGPGELIENLPYRLRRKTASDDPTKGDGAVYQTPLVWEPKDSSSDPGDLIDYPNNVDWFTEGGTTGGVFGGFERAEVLDALIRDADTGLGSMRQLAFSARGATSDGDATFGTGLTRIAFKSEFGRLTEIRFERVGRISWFRHKARHVIVYRLRATPGKQFADRQDKHKGRLIIRKDEEFIELVEPLRDFPGRDTGPLEAFEFRDHKIRVDGTWSHGLGEDGPYRGYAIPLSRAEVDKSIYPRPDCACHMAGPNGDVFPRSVGNPDIIRFYSLTELNGAAPSGDTDSWPNIYGVDYADRRLDEPLADNVVTPGREDFGAASDPARPLPAEPLVVPGLEEFTLLLEQGQPVNLMAGRPADPVYCDMRSLVVMRAAHSHVPGEGRTAQLPAVTSGQRVVRQAQRLADAARSQSPTGWTLNSLKQAVKETREGVAAFPSSGGTFSDQILSIADGPLKRLEDLSARLAKLDQPHELQAMWNSGRQRLVDQLVALERDVGSIMPVGNHLYAETERLLRLDEAESKLKEEITRFLSTQAGRVDQLCADLLEQLGDLKGSVLAAFAAAQLQLDEATPNFAAAREQAALAAQRIGQASAQVQLRLRELPVLSGKIEDLSRQYADRVPALAQFAQRLAAELRKAPQLAQRAAALELTLRAKIDSLVSLIDLGEDQVDDAKDALAKLIQAFDDGFVTEVIAPVSDFRKQWQANGPGNLAPVVTNAREIVDKVISGAGQLIGKSKQHLLDKVALAAHGLLGEVLVVLHLVRSEVGAAEPPEPQLTRLAALASKAKTEVDAIIGAVGGLRKELSDALSTGLDTLKNFADDAVRKLQELENQLDQLIAAGAQVDAAYREIAKQIDLFETSARRFAEGVNKLLDGEARKDLLKPLNQRVKADNLQEAIGLRLLRGCGAPPVVENLIFNREQIGYHYRAEYDRLVTTPMTALVDQGQQVLRAFGVTQPVLGIGSEFLSPISGAFDDVKGAADKLLANLEMKGNEVLRDLAGLKKLFPSMPYNRELAKAIIVKHGFDPASGQAWLLAKLDHKIGRQPIFEQEMFSLIAENARLTAEARFEEPVTGGEQSAGSKAEVALDIVFMIGGTRLLAVRDAKVLFDGTGLKFKIRPEKIEFNKLLQLVSDAIRSITGEDSPLQLELLVDEESGRPIGLASKYDLPPVSFGPILNAALGVHLILAQRETFRIESMAYLGRKDAPFALVYGILGGGGYIEVNAAHIPETGRTELAIAISIGASAGAGFSFGPLRGSVSVYLGFTLDYVSKTGGERLIIGAVLVVNGSVCAWGIVTLGLGLRLSITYDGRQMIGVGGVTATVKISRFFKKKFRRNIRYRP